ncbi:UNKNOWN [Stylonychia lemnae]|uniref:PHD-type domain-containing protein n=1 Tax=Stylonychia lemnae TaxID=5949 RepID=A0A077ZT71_STYLE|nr:UNKNOWN [Stylonychia lemnae]|eukprot:CDW72759.1 UNKNOWN [Stylonychia lemnae]
MAEEDLEIQKTQNRAIIDQLIKKFVNSYESGYCEKEQNIYTQKDPEYYYLQSQKRLDDLKQYYNQYIRDEKNLLIDIEYPNMLEEKFYEIVYKKTSFKLQDTETRLFFSEMQRQSRELGSGKSQIQGDNEDKKAIIEQSQLGHKNRKLNNQGQTDDDICFVCGDGDYEDDNLIVYCEKCNISAHQMCYGIDNLDDDVEWICNNCEAFGEIKGLIIACQLCGLKGGAMRPCNVRRQDLIRYFQQNQEIVITNPKGLSQQMRGIDQVITRKQIIQKEKLTLELKHQIQDSSSQGNDKNSQLDNQVKDEENYKLKLTKSQEFDEFASQYVWVHQNCGLWQSYKNPIIESNMLFDAREFDFNYYFISCFICDDKNTKERIFTSKYKCADTQCQVVFHIECA